RELQLVRAVALEADGFYEKSGEFGAKASGCFPGKQKSQMKNLESIANSSLKVADVLDYVKKQIGKDKPDNPWREDRFGESLLTHLETDIRKRVGTLTVNPPVTDRAESQRVQLQLIREFVRQMVAQYEFRRGTN
ncbi:MAG: hypothetical protein Q8P50_15025, partial [Bacillota bacterium]|nr:hypothetical protein [Bacillota bacterium]